MNKITKVQIETIHACNGKCRICNWKDGYQRYSQMTNDVFYAIIRQISELPNLQTVCPYNHNEPLLDSGIFHFCRHIKSGLGKKIELSTNGIVLNDYKMDQMCELVDDIWISFHGISKETYERNMGVLWRIGQNVRRMIKERPDKQFSISTALIDYSKKDIENYWRDYDNVKLITFEPRDRCGNIDSDVCKNFYKPCTSNWNCWRFDMFLVYNTEGYLIPCSNDLKEKHKYASYKMDLGEIMKARETFRTRNKALKQSICWRCNDHD